MEEIERSPCGECKCKNFEGSRFSDYGDCEECGHDVGVHYKKKYKLKEINKKIDLKKESRSWS